MIITGTAEYIFITLSLFSLADFNNISDSYKSGKRLNEKHLRAYQQD